MATSLIDLRNDFVDQISLYKTPIVYNNTLYDKIVLKAVKSYYVDTGKESSFNSQYVAGATPTLIIDLSLTECEYITTWSQILFIDQIKSDVSKLVSYSNDALSVTQADKPWRNLSEDRKILENRLLELFYKLSGVSTMSPVTSITVTTLDVTYE